MIDQKTKNLLLYIAEELLEQLKADTKSVGDQEKVQQLGKVVEFIGRYAQARGSGPGYMKATKLEFLELFTMLDGYEAWVDKADEIESEGGFLPE